MPKKSKVRPSSVAERMAGTSWFMPALRKWSSTPAGAARSALTARVSSGASVSLTRSTTRRLGEPSMGSTSGCCGVGVWTSRLIGICQRAPAMVSMVRMFCLVKRRCSGGLVLSSVTNALESGRLANHRAEQHEDNAGVGDDESEVPPLPRPAGEGGAEEVERQRHEPEVEPDGVVDVIGGDRRIELRLHHRGERDGGGDGDEQKNGEVEGTQDVHRRPENRSLAALADLRATQRFGGRLGRGGHSGERQREDTACQPGSFVANGSPTKSKTRRRARYKLTAQWARNLTNSRHGPGFH